MCLFILGYLLVAVITLYAQPQRVARMDKNGDDKISKHEFEGLNKMFTAMNTDGDRYVSKEESQNFRKTRKSKNINIENNEKQTYPDLIIKKYDKKRAWPGNIVFADSNRKCIVEANLEGKVVWQHSLPNAKLLGDVELLPNDNVLVLSAHDGIYEINRYHKVVWSYKNKLVDHDIDRLQNGNTLIASASSEKASEFPYKDPQVFEVNPKGEIVWKWYAKTEYANSKYKDIRSKDANDWVHVNSVQRLNDGLTLISMRNWNLLIAVDEKGLTKWKTGATELRKQGAKSQSPSCPHTAVLLENGNIIVSEPVKGRVIEWDPKQEKVVWSYALF
ncbi:MAG: aryl-sulfate sulfotransferase [Nitrospirae bacterium]|nr:aryl-sulfate sulfotransferase [Nitrospirota bacterium]